MVDPIDLEKELHLMRTVWPILRYIEDKFVFMLDHGPLHADRVKRIATQMSYLLGLTSLERSFLRAAAIVHDIGMSKGGEDKGEEEVRYSHQEWIREILRDLVDRGELQLNTKQVDLIADIAEKHSKPYDSTTEIQSRNGSKIRTGLLGATLRVADAMDMDQRRTPNFNERRPILERDRPEQLKYHESAAAIKGIKLICEGNFPSIQVFTENPRLAQYHISELSRELSETPMPWPITVFNLTEKKDYHYYQIPGHIKKALICAYCNPHGIIMAALSKNNLVRRGIEADICCSYKETGNLEKFWKECFPVLRNKTYNLYVFAGLPIEIEDPHRTVKELTPLLKSGKAIYYCHYLERSFEALQEFIKNGIKVGIGDAWSAFISETPTLEDLYWARIAALITRDRSLLPILKTQQGESLLKGILYVFHQAVNEESNQLIEEMIMNICDDNRDYFIRESKSWDHLCRNITDKAQKILENRGKVLYIEAAQNLNIKARTLYRVLDEIMMQLGAGEYEKDVTLKYPYIIAKYKRPDGKIQVLFQSCWRVEGLIPIKFFSKTGEDLLISGDHTIWILFSSDEEAKKTIDETIDKINRKNSILKGF